MAVQTITRREFEYLESLVRLLRAQQESIYETEAQFARVVGVRTVRVYLLTRSATPLAEWLDHLEVRVVA